MQEKNNKGVVGQLHLNKIRNKSSNEPQSDVKNQAVGKPAILDWVNYNLKVNDGKDGGAKAVTASEQKVADAVDAKSKPKVKEKWTYEGWADGLEERTRPVEKPKKKSPRMSAKTSWNLIKQSMNNDELKEWYRDHPEDKPAEYKPYEPDPVITEMYNKKFGEDF